MQVLDAWISRHPGDKDKLTSTVTVIRSQNGGLAAVPYSQEYAQWLKPAAKLLREAAAITKNASLQKFLELRAAAFDSDDYYASDFAWMDLDAPVEVTIGPYETYEDDLYGYKAAFEAFVTVNLPKESAALALYKERLPWLERNLPIPDADKNLNRGTESPIRVVDTVDRDVDRCVERVKSRMMEEQRGRCKKRRTRTRRMQRGGRMRAMCDSTSSATEQEM